MTFWPRCRFSKGSRCAFLGFHLFFVPLLLLNKKHPSAFFFIPRVSNSNSFLIHENETHKASSTSIRISGISACWLPYWNETSTRIHIRIVISCVLIGGWNYYQRYVSSLSHDKISITNQKHEITIRIPKAEYPDISSTRLSPSNAFLPIKNFYGNFLNLRII